MTGADPRVCRCLPQQSHGSVERERQARAEAEHKYRVTLNQLEALTDHETRLREEKADVERRLASTTHDLKEVSHGPRTRVVRHTTYSGS